MCLDEVFVAHPLLEGIDGIVLDDSGNIWGTAHERNAIVRVTPDAKVREVFRNPMDATTLLRNGGPLEFPTSPFLSEERSAWRTPIKAGGTTSRTAAARLARV